MYSKLALSNVKKSFKDYSIYFLTLTLSVCIFYSFNSIESQRAFFEIGQSELESLQIMIKAISIISIFVSFILGSLIVYANNFLIKKRKKEFGIYMSLGMSKNKISRILVTETIIVGMASLVSGLLIGIVVSQGLSVFTAKLFEVPITEYSFVISGGAIGKTMLYFGIIFILVMIFNTIIISKYKIIDLLTSSRKNEDIKIKNPYVYIVSFIISVIMIGLAYYLIKNSIIEIEYTKVIDPMALGESILLGILGTLLFFFSLAGFTVNIIKNTEKIYFKDINIFILNNLNSKINTNFISMSVICLMLFLTIGILSTGLSFKSTLQSNLEKTLPFDVSATMYISKDEKNKSIESCLNNIGFKFDNNEKYVYFNEYEMNETIKESLDKYINKNDNKILNGQYGSSNIKLIKISEYNSIRKLNGKDKLILKDNEILVTSNVQDVVDLVNNILKYNKKINLDEKEYIIKNKKVITDANSTDGFTTNTFTLIVPDNNVKTATLSSSHLNVNYYKKNAEKSEKKFLELFNDFKEGKVDYNKTGFILGETKDSIQDENKGITTILLFVAIYLGIIFLIASMAVLALQQLSEASDSIDRYKSLKRIGANDKMINKSIFIQTLIYFTLPLTLAFIHSIVGINVVNQYIKMFGKPDIIASSIMTILMFIIIYTGYFLATYISYKNIIKNS